MTGLDSVADALIEVAVIVTDSELNILGEGVDVVIAPPPGALESMGDFVRNMHTASGLLEELPSGVTMQEAQDRVLKYITAHVPEPRRAQLGGNSVGTDRVFLARDMPLVVEHLHYRVVDVTGPGRWGSECLEKVVRKVCRIVCAASFSPSKPAPRAVHARVAYRVAWWV